MSRSRLPGLVALVALAGVLALPLLALLSRALGHLAEAGEAWDVALNSLALSALGTLLTLGLGLALGWAALLGGVGRSLEGLLLLGYFIPPFVTGMGVLFSMELLGLRLPGALAILLAWTLHYSPLAYVLLKPALGNLLPSLRAAQVHGVLGGRRVRVLFPPLLPALLAVGGALYLALLGNFGVPAVLGLPDRVYVLPTLAYARLTSPVSPDPLGEASALGLLLGLLALPALLLHRPPQVEALGEGFTIPYPVSRLLFGAYALLALLLAGMGLLKEALFNPYTGSLQPAFSEALAMPLVRQGLLHSFLLAMAASLATLLLALLLRPFPGAFRALRGLFDLYYLLPGTLLGLGLILLLAPTPLYATVWILLLAYLLNFASLAFRALEAGARVEAQVAAARVHGLSPFRAWLRVGFPLLRPQALGGFLVIFPLALSEITLSALLYAPGAETVGVAVLGALNGGLYREAAAIGLLLALVSALPLLARRGPW
jgi:iron(III) transport system permease protein